MNSNMTRSLMKTFKYFSHQHLKVAKKVSRQEQRRIALERIQTLFAEAEKAFKEHPERSDRYVQLALRIGMRSQMRVPRELKRRVCKHCRRFLVPGRNCTVRLHDKRVIYRCACCGVMRYPYVR